MKSNQTLLLGIVAILAVLAAVLWGTKPTPAPAPKPPVATKPASAKQDAAPVAPPAPVSPTGLPELPTTGMPINPTQTGEVPPMREARAFYGIVDNLEQLSKLFDETVKSTGGELLEKSLLAAKWRLMASLPGRALFLEMQTDADGGMSVKDEQLGTEWFLVRDECRVRREKLVAPCLREQNEFIHGLYMGQLSAVPLRLKGYSIAMDSVIDTRDAVFVRLPAPAEHEPAFVHIKRSDGTVSEIHTGRVLTAPERHRADDDWTTPAGWSMEAREAAGDQAFALDAKRGAGKLAWQAAVRVVEVKPSKDKALIKLPELTGPEPLSVSARPAMSVAVIAQGARLKAPDAENKMAKAARFEAMLDFAAFESFAPADKVPNLSQNVALYILVPPQAGAVLNEKAVPKEIPAEPRIARKVIRTQWSDIPDQLVKFVGEVNEAGYHFGPGPTLVRHVAMSGQSLVAELQVPLLPK